MNTFTFAIPKRKKRIFCKKEAPFPVPIATVTGRPASSNNWEHYTGQLVDGHVIINDRTDAEALYKMGFFGKGTLSRSQPEHGQIRPVKRRYKHAESNTMERTLQLVSRRKYLCHMTWHHQRAVQRGESPPDSYTESDDIEMQDDQATYVPHKHHITSAQDITKTSLPSWHQHLGEESSFPVSGTMEFGTGDKVKIREEEADGKGDVEKDPWAGGDTIESLQFWGDVPAKSKATMDWDEVGEKEAREFWGMGKTDNEDPCRDKTDIHDTSSLVTAGTDDVTSLAAKSDDVTLRTAQSDDVTLRTAKSDDVTLRTANSDDVTLRTAQSDDVTSKLTQSDDVTLHTSQTGAESKKQNVSHLKERTINASVCDPKASSNPMSNEGITKGQSSATRDVDPRSLSAEEGGEWFVVPDSWDTDQEVEGSTAQLPWQPVIKRDPFRLHECLQLSLVEAFFLSYGLGCLTVIDREKGVLSVTEMWTTFCQCQKTFLRDYVAYHNFRSKGWVPKTGLKYGAEFILYKDGPPFYHASYSVMVRLVTDDLEDDQGEENRPLTWTSLAGLNRMTEQVGKEVMFCYVIKPKDISPADLHSPDCLLSFKVQEVILRRWVSAQEREHTEYSDIP
ncbi:hypothetical protein LSAT2_007946 [Lamellibrachia satsuma]|nr:hypothetical protein LSAT2_007946 [Lamellibrachia satsuma]